MAISEDLARAAAEAGSVPALYSTLTLGAALRMNFSGEEGNHIGFCHSAEPGLGSIAFPPGGSTCAEPPPERTPTSAWEQMTAMERTLSAESGRILSEFFRRTVLSSAICCASSRPLKGSTTRRGR